VLVSQNIDTELVLSDPFPLVVVKNVLPLELLADIQRALPPLEVMLQGKPFTSNQRFNYSAADVAANSDIAAVVKDLVSEHLGQAFLNDIIRLFHKQILVHYPNFEERFGPISALKAGIRGQDNDALCNVFLDSQIAFNTPVEIGGTTVRGPHLDDPRKLFVGLFYLRLDGDQSRGADLEIYRSKVNPANLDITRTASIADMELVETVKYEANTLVLFLNTPKSFHGVKPRSRTPYHRVFLNLLGEMPEPLFEIEANRDRLYGSKIATNYD
jgi:hypothetical protein